jgi:CspA family cold shock protein
MSEIGRIKSYNTVKGYGYILRDGKPDLFFHVESLKDKYYLPLRDVEFSVHKGERGEMAIDIMESSV